MGSLGSLDDTFTLRLKKRKEKQESLQGAGWLKLCVGWKDSLVLKVFEQKEGMVVYRDRPGGLEKTAVVSVWMKKDTG